MAKEIHEQPEVVAHTLRALPRHGDGQGAPAVELPFDSNELDRITISACGTALLRRARREILVRALRRVCRSRSTSPPNFATARRRCRAAALAIFVSQSGETADTLAALRYAKEPGQHILAVVNVPTLTIARESDIVLPTLAGPEIGVASTKAFTCQLAVLAGLAIGAGRARGSSSTTRRRALVGALIEMPRPDGRSAEARARRSSAIARDLAKVRDVLYLGRGTTFPLALEGALKLKEISYIHAEGYAAGELKHGPIALIDEAMPVVVIAPSDRAFEKTVSNMQEVAARGGRIILIARRRRAAEAADRRALATRRAAGRWPRACAARLCAAGATARLSRRGFDRHRRRPAAQPGQVVTVE